MANMLKKYTLGGKLSEDGKSFLFDNALAVSRTLQSWQDLELTVDIQKLSKQRSSQQNRYFHGVIVPIAQSFIKSTQGEDLDIEQAKVWIYTEILGDKLKIKQVGKQTIVTLSGTRCHQWKTVEFNAYKEHIQWWFAEHDVEVPDPIGNSLHNDYMRA